MGLVIGAYYRGDPRVKPAPWGNASQVQSSIFANAEREGYDPGSIALAMPFWERAGSVAHDYANLQKFGSLGVDAAYTKNAIRIASTLDYNDKITLTPSLDIAAGSDITMITSLTPTGFFSNNPGFWRDNDTSTGDNFFILQGDSKQPWIRWDGTDILKPLSGEDIEVNKTVNIAYRVTSGASAAFFKNGKLEHSATHAKSTTAFNIVRYGLQNVVGECILGLHHFVFFFSVALTDSQIAYLSDNPYFLLQRQPSVFYSVPSGAITIKTITDTGSGLDSIAQISNFFSVSDVGSGVDDFAGLTAGLSVVDVGSGADTVQADAAVTVQDTGLAIDLIQQISAACSVADTGTGTDNIGQLLASLVVSDTGSGADVVTVLKELLKTVTDSGTGTDAVSQILASLSVADTGSGADFISVLKDILKTITDTGSGTDSVSIQPVSVSVQDAGTALDLIGHIAVALSVSDAGTIAEIISTIKTKLVTVTDTGTGTDSTPTISVSLTVSDAAAALDVVGLVLNSLTVSDTGTGLESITKTDFDLLPSGKVTVTFTMKTPGATFDLKTPGATFTIK